MNASHLLPQFAGLASLVLIVNNFLSYAGMEVNAVHVKSMKNPGKEFPKAMFIAMPLVVAIFVLPALAISWVVPSAELTLTGGVMQAFTAFFTHFNVEWLTPILGIMLITASLGGMMAWLAGPSKGLLLIGRKEGYLPPFFQKVNAAGIQVNILFVQGAIVSVIALMFALIPNVSSVYWIFSVITTQVYLIMYFLMFISVMRLRRTQPDHPRGYRAPMVFVLAMRRLRQLRAGVPHRLRAVVAVRQRQHDHVRPHHRRRPAAHRPRRAVPLPQAPQAELEERRAGARRGTGLRGVMTVEEKSHTWIYVVVIVAILALMVAGVALYDHGKNTREARAKAREFISKMEAAGYKAPSQAEVVSLFGADGGAAAKNPDAALLEAQYAAQLGTAGPASRPIILDPDFVHVAEIFLSVYAPQKLAGFQDFVRGLKLGNTQ